MTASKVRLAKLEARLAPAPGGRTHVISNTASASDIEGSFLARHGRFRTDAEMDREEAALRASGVVQPGDRVTRIVRVIVDPPGPGRLQ